MLRTAHRALSIQPSTASVTRRAGTDSRRPPLDGSREKQVSNPALEGHTQHGGARAVGRLHQVHSSSGGDISLNPRINRWEDVPPPIEAGHSAQHTIRVRRSAHRGNPPQAFTTIHIAPGTLDGSGAGDRDRPYVFGRRPHSYAPGSFTTRQYLRLVVVRSRVDASLVGADDLQLALENTSYTTGALS